MRWADDIDFNRRALLRVLAMLFAAAGMVPGGAPQRVLPRYLYRHLLRLLRPAESAARRLIAVSAQVNAFQGVAVSLPPARPARPEIHRRPQPHRGSQFQAIKAKAAARAEAARKRLPSFPLYDAARQVGFRPQWRRPAVGPRLTVIGVTEFVPSPPEPSPTPDDPVEALTLCKRLLSLQRVLDDIPYHAQRLARLCLRSTRLAWRGPIRGGRPPGHRKHPIHKVDEVLADSHQLALRAFEELRLPDT